MRHTKASIRAMAVKAIIEYWNLKPTRVTLTRQNTLHIHDFAIWLLAKKRDHRRANKGMRILDLLWNNPHYLGFRIEMGRYDRRYIFNMGITYEGRETKIWAGLNK